MGVQVLLGVEVVTPIRAQRAEDGTWRIPETIGADTDQEQEEEDVQEELTGQVERHFRHALQHPAPWKTRRRMTTTFHRFSRISSGRAA